MPLYYQPEPDPLIAFVAQLKAADDAEALRLLKNMLREVRVRANRSGYDEGGQDAYNRLHGHEMGR